MGPTGDARALARGSSPPYPAHKLAVIQSAATHAYPTGEIDEMLAQTEAGYVGHERASKTPHSHLSCT